MSKLRDKDALDYGELVKKFTKSGQPATKLIGYEGTIKIIEGKIRDLVNARTKGPEFALITGPSATGKTTVVRRLAEQYSAKLTFFYIKSSWMLEKQFGNPEIQIRSIFEEAVTKAPSLVFIDQIDKICPERRTPNDSKDRISNVLVDKFDDLIYEEAKVLVLAATDKQEFINAEFRKPCYLGDEIKFSLPSILDRTKYLTHIVKELRKNLSKEELEQIAVSCHCYSYADLRKICNIASRYCQLENKGVLNHESFKKALGEYKPVTIKSITTPCPPLRWSDIGGFESVKADLQRSVTRLLNQSEDSKKKGPHRKGTLLYGPPGCSKTMLARALATESGYNFIAIKGPELMNKYVGESEAAVRKLYRNAREIAPCIIFFDEIDSFTSERGDNQSSTVGEKMLAQLLTELDGFEPLNNVFTIAATNRPNRIDNALLRPGRLRPAIYISLPTEPDRGAIFKVCLEPYESKLVEPIEKLLPRLATLTDGYSGAEIEEVCDVAAQLAEQDNPDSHHIEWRHLEKALENVDPETTSEQLQVYENFHKKKSRPKNRDITVKKKTKSKRRSLNRLMQLLRLNRENVS